jgi:dihydrofolate synthase / folylpolyglutamate synthase
VTFQDAQAYLDSLGIDLMRSRPPSLHRIDAMCAALDHPERSIPAIHITGTNGKSSTARLASAVLAATGLSVGTYTSPHLSSVRERIALSGEPLSETVFGAVFDHFFPYLQVVEKDLDEKLSYFEVLTALFFLWAAEAPVDALVVEVGLGGLWDATNVVDAPVVVITNVALDHVNLLGNTPESIAAEKAGIIKTGAHVVTGERAPSVLGVIAQKAESKAAPVATIDRDFFVEDNRVAFGGRYLTLVTSGGRHEGLFLPLHGGHQGMNAAIALEASARFLGGRALDTEVVAEALRSATVPGRLETINPRGAEGPTVVLDVAHNPDAFSALVSSLVEAFAPERVHFVIGILSDKDYKGMLAELTRVPCTVTLTRPQSVRSVPTDDLEAAAAGLGLETKKVPSVVEATAAAVGGWAPGELVCVTGSHYVVGEARPHLVSEEGPGEG